MTAEADAPEILSNSASDSIIEIVASGSIGHANDAGSGKSGLGTGCGSVSIFTSLLCFPESKVFQLLL
jgi:hypothetical protein